MSTLFTLFRVNSNVHDFVLLGFCLFLSRELLSSIFFSRNYFYDVLLFGGSGVHNTLLLHCLFDDSLFSRCLWILLLLDRCQWNWIFWGRLSESKTSRECDSTMRDDLLVRCAEHQLILDHLAKLKHKLLAALLWMHSLPSLHTFCDESVSFIQHHSLREGQLRLTLWL